MTVRYMRCFCAVLIIWVLAMPVLAEDDRGWTISGRFQGSSNSSGVVTKVDPTLGYSFNRHFQTYAGLPVYFIHESSTLTTSTAPAPTGFVNGIGNAYLGFQLAADNPAVNFASNLVFTAPTGDKDKGFSTGRMTVDWNNSFSHRFSSVTPFANAGVANTVSDTSFFVRPFSSLGLVGHFDGGATATLSPLVGLGASAYAVRASGEQRIFSRVKPRDLRVTQSTSLGSNSKRVFETSGETLASADAANDHGFSTWFAVHPGSNVDFQVGYSRSMSYDLNTLFFGVGFRLGK